MDLTPVVAIFSASTEESMSASHHPNAKFVFQLLNGAHESCCFSASGRGHKVQKESPFIFSVWRAGGQLPCYYLPKILSLTLYNPYFIHIQKSSCQQALFLSGLFPFLNKGSVFAATVWADTPKLYCSIGFSAAFAKRQCRYGFYKELCFFH